MISDVTSIYFRVHEGPSWNQDNGGRPVELPNGGLWAELLEVSVGKVLIPVVRESPSEAVTCTVEWAKFVHCPYFVISLPEVNEGLQCAVYVRVSN